MKILWVKAGKLLPVDSGGKIRSFNLLRELAARHETALLSYYPGDPDAEYDERIRSVIADTVTVPYRAPSTGMGTALHYAARFPSAVPYAVSKFTSPAARRLIQQWMVQNRFDVMVCDFLSATLTFPARLSTPTALFQHNVESALWARQALHERDPIKRAVYRIEAYRMDRYEHQAVERFHHVIAVSESDRVLMSRMTDASRITVAPTGVDVSRYREAQNAEADEPIVLFLGSMDWEANVDGVEFFHQNIWPRIRDAVPNATFRIVGRNPSARVRRLCDDPSVQVTGAVPDVVAHLREAAVFVVPLRIGGGTRLKIYEAMAAGRAVVSTTVGAEGLDFENGRDLIVADTPESFANSVVALLRDRAYRQAVAHAAAERSADFDWSAVVTHFENSLRCTIEAAGAAVPRRHADAL